MPKIHELLLAPEHGLDCAAKERTVTNQLHQMQKNAEGSNLRLKGAENVMKSIPAALDKQKQSMQRLKTKVATVNSRIAELERDLRQTRTELKTAQTATWEASQFVLAIQGVITNIATQLTESIGAAVRDARVRIDSIRNPSGGGVGGRKTDSDGAPILAVQVAAVAALPGCAGTGFITVIAGAESSPS